MVLRERNRNLVSNQHKFLTPFKQHLRVLSDLLLHDINTVLGTWRANKVRMLQVLDYLKSLVTANEVITKEADELVLHRRRVHWRVAHELFKPSTYSCTGFHRSLEAFD